MGRQREDESDKQLPGLCKSVSKTESADITEAQYQGGCAHNRLVTLHIVV